MQDCNNHKKKPRISGWNYRKELFRRERGKIREISLQMKYKESGHKITAACVDKVKCDNIFDCRYFDFIIFF